ncbi:MAG: hypothetical protein SH847_20020 [Roseiflexaceae bacterium]|nr:hypothetical protein [Roseiflexaceae bacterium]
MRTRLVLKPGQRGTIKLVAEYGDRLICVRYRYDAERNRRLKTIELIVKETLVAPKEPAIDQLVYLQIAWGERDLAFAVKQAGGIWDARRKLWKLRYIHVARLGLVDRIIELQ